MLRHDDSSETNTSPAAQIRVTPQELAAALARLEARQGGLDGTIPLGDAVQELGLNTTPEELLREIEAGRAHPQESQSRTHPPRSNWLGVGTVFALSLTLFGGMFAFLRTAPPIRTSAAINIPPAAPQAAPIGVPDNLLVRQPDHKMALLSEVPDEQPVLCDLAETQYSAHLADFAPGIYHWTLIKHGGKVYVRGWIGDMSDTALRSTVVEVHPISYWVTAGIHPVRVTLPLSGFQSPPGLTSDNLISAGHIVPDEHFKEKW